MGRSWTKHQETESKVENSTLVRFIAILLYAHIIFIQYNCLYTYYVRVICIYFLGAAVHAVVLVSMGPLPGDFQIVSFRHRVIGESKAGGYPSMFGWGMLGVGCH